MWDDLFYNGAALNLAAGGDFSNPLLAGQNFPSHHFFVYPPLHSYAVYGWLSVFGVSSASMLGFENMMYFIIAASTILILGRLRAPGPVLWLAPLAVTAPFLNAGLRPDAFAVAATMGGYALFLYQGKKFTWLLLSLALVFLGGMASPRNVIFSGVFVLAIGWQYVKFPAWSRSAVIQYFAAVALAFAVVGFTFLVCIGFEPLEFYRNFHLHATRLDQDKLYLFHGFANRLGYRSIPSILLIVIFWFAIFRRRIGAEGLLLSGTLRPIFWAALIGGLRGPEEAGIWISRFWSWPGSSRKNFRAECWCSQILR